MNKNAEFPEEYGADSWNQQCFHMTETKWKKRELQEETMTENSSRLQRQMDFIKEIDKE